MHYHFRARVQFICGSSVQTSTPFYEVLRWSRTNHGVRASWYLACEMDSEQEEALDIYYGRLLKVISFQVDVNSALSEKWAIGRTRTKSVFLTGWRGWRLGHNCRSSRTV